MNAETSKRILVADDAETITSLLMTALETSGYEVTVTTNGVEAYEMGLDGSGRVQRTLSGMCFPSAASIASRRVLRSAFTRSMDRSSQRR